MRIDSRLNAATVRQAFNKKIRVSLFIFFAAAELSYAKIKPVFFAGLGAQLAFPSFSLKKEGAAGFGGGAYLEGGLEASDFQAEIIASFTRLSSGGGLLERLDEAKIGLGASYVLRKSNVGFLPDWLNLRPHASVFADLYDARVYRNSVQKDEGVLSSARGVTPIFNVGLFIDFPNLIAFKHQKIIPTLGIEESFRFDEQSGLYATPILNAGARIFFAKLPKATAPKRQQTPPEQSPQPAMKPRKPIELPFILFAPYSSSLADGAPRDRRINETALSSLTRILNENPEYGLTILGYANSTTGNETENDEELIPLSRERAAAVMAELEKRGVAKERMSIQGVGKAEEAAADGWKNRRVEFQLVQSN
ncbi:MAG: OmpA family protein [Treponema sp.]